MKVKKFRIRPRLPSVGKNLKAIMGVKQIPAEIEASLPKESEVFLGNVLPAAFYHTWSRDDVPAHFRSVMDAAGLGKSIAVSAVVASVGPGPEEMLAELLMNGETQRSQVITAFAEEGADLSFAFIYRLLADDAKNDDCEVSEPIGVDDSTLLTETLGLLEAEQENITVDAASHLSPRFTRVALVAWRPIAKKKRPIAPSKKKAA